MLAELINRPQLEFNNGLTVKLDKASAEAIANWAERITALVYLQMGYEVYHEVPVGQSRIDFLVKGPNSNLFLLLEVSGETEARVKRDVRKKRQIQSMLESGIPFRVLAQGAIKDMQRQYGVK